MGTITEVFTEQTSEANGINEDEEDNNMEHEEIRPDPIEHLTGIPQDPEDNRTTVITPQMPKNHRKARYKNENIQKSPENAPSATAPHNIYTRT